MAGGPEIVAIPQPSSLWGASEATFTSSAGWSDNGAVSYVTADPGEAQIDGTLTSTWIQHDFDVPMNTSNVYGVHLGIDSLTAGRHQLQTRGVTNDLFGGNGYLGAHRVARYEPANAQTTFRALFLSQDGNPQLDVIDCQVYDISTQISQPKAIILQFGQSNRVGAFGVTGYDAELDKPEFRALAVPTIEQTSVGAETDNTGATYSLASTCGVGVAMPMTTPLPSATPAQINAGDPPSTTPYSAEARYLCDNWPAAYDGYTPTFLLSAATATSLFSQSGWDPTTSPQGGYLRLMKANIDALLAEDPDNFIAGAVWQQGEADQSNHASYNAQFTTMIEELRTAYGEFPLVIAEIGGKTSIGGIANMIAAQQKLDSNSGDADALPLCTYVPRPAGDPGQDGEDLLEDEGGNWIHFRADTNRQIGLSVAQALVALMTA